METKLILEFGCNHNGIEEKAFEMIDKAAALGVWGIKFQKRDLASMPDHLKLLERNPVTSFGPNYYEHRKALEFSVEQLKKLREYAEGKGLHPVVTVFDVESVYEAIEAGFTHIKIPSQLYSNYGITTQLLYRKACGYVKNLYRSTGMHSIDEVLGWPYLNGILGDLKGWEGSLVYEEKHNMFFDVTFYCRSIYPCPPENIRFDWMLKIKEALKVGVLGYSSHEKEGAGIPLSVMLGAEYIERHFTLDNNMKGSDHKTVSSDPEEMRGIIEDIEDMERAIEPYSLCEAEEKLKKEYRSFY